MCQLLHIFRNYWSTYWAKMWLCAAHELSEHVGHWLQYTHTTHPHTYTQTHTHTHTYIYICLCVYVHMCVYVMILKIKSFINYITNVTKSLQMTNMIYDNILNLKFFIEKMLMITIHIYIQYFNVSIFVFLEPMFIYYTYHIK